MKTTILSGTQHQIWTHNKQIFHYFKNSLIAQKYLISILGRLKLLIATDFENKHHK